ncbi:DUF1801 domain-containing protein [Cognatitamlana onchidii]|uniref:DUF1801 domain-containing protein n=1 Tax=Cognatitamlana onchidii TaxID=2562860 RepID=UPI0010A617FC|nr:DUF1801 domain-containing protein [Algibacter onchidii]
MKNRNFELVTQPKVKEVFNNYPRAVKPLMLNLRDLVLEAASEIDGLNKLEETLKWGEPSYLAKYGSTIRMDWKPKTPNQYALYFQCSSRLVSTFKVIYKSELSFEGNRAIIFKYNDSLPKRAVKHCIKMALTYHKIKHLPLLGA